MGITFLLMRFALVRLIDAQKAKVYRHNAYHDLGPGNSLSVTVTGHGPSFWPLFLLFSEFVGKNMLKMGTNTGPVTGHGEPRVVPWL